MDQGIENMSLEQLKTLIQEQQKENIVLISTNQNLSKEKDQLKQKNEVHIAKVITSYENKVRVIEEKNESLFKKFQDLLEKFSSMQFDFSQLKRLVKITPRI